jgi:hypothetical protein
MEEGTMRRRLGEGAKRAAIAWALPPLLVALCLIRVSGAPVSQEAAERLAAAFLDFELAEGMAALRDPAWGAIQETSELRDPSSWDVLAYVSRLDPEGYIVVTADTRLVPVIAYSESSDFVWEETPFNALLCILRADLRLRVAALRDGVYAQEEIDKNEALRSALLSADVPTARADSWGPWIGFPTWNQGAPYWDLCPIDPITGERCYVGCGPTALSQVLNYWQFPSAVAFTHADDYTSTKDPGDGYGERVINIDATRACIALIGYNGQLPSSEMKAAISYAAGVSLKTKYSSGGSGASCANIAAALAGTLPSWSWVVPQRWQYVSAEYRTTDIDWQPWPPYYATVEEIHSLLQSDAMSAHPSIIVVQSDVSGHFVVVDGYRATGEYHVNFGWGGSSDGWYFLPSGLPNNYNVVTDAVVSIAPALSPAGTPAVFRADASGAVYADGAFYGAGFFSGFADVAEWVLASEPGEPGDVLELDAAHPGSYRLTQTPCSSDVAGVVSTEPGVVLGGTSPVEGAALLALSGIVPVKVTNEGGPIQPGDLLVSSSTPGYAMRWAGAEPCPCALVGKALEAMLDERGVILVLLTAH